MDISLLLSTAQPRPCSNARRPSQPDYLVSSPVSQQHDDPPIPPIPDDMSSFPQQPHVLSASPPSSTLTRLPNRHPNFSLRAEQGRVDKKTNKPFRCSIEGCDATFGQKGSLTRHIRSRHEKLRPHSCDLCQKSFSALWTLRVHQRNVHLKSKPHKCHLCDKSFGELFNKSKHIAIVHEGKRPFSCPICSRAFGYKGDMRKHVLELHEQSGRPFQCMVPSCGVKFARKRYLRRHENLTHKGNMLWSNRQFSPVTQTPSNISYLHPGQSQTILHLGNPPGQRIFTGNGESVGNVSGAVLDGQSGRGENIRKN